MINGSDNYNGTENISNGMFNKIDLSEVSDKFFDFKPQAKGAKYEIVSRVAYLIGVRKDIFENANQPPQIDIYNKLKINKNARIVRNLCRLRTQLEINFFKICNAMQRDNKSLIGMPEYLPVDTMEELSQDGVAIYQHTNGKSPSPFLFMINNEIKNRINNCQNLFPEWLEWK